MNERGFTLLEVLVASLIMAVAVVGLLSGISTSMHNAARLTDYERAVMAARSKMDALLLDTGLPKFSVIEGAFDAALMGGMQGGWRARVTPYERPGPGAPAATVLERVELEVWWKSGERRRTFALEAFRRATWRPEELAFQPQ